MSVNSTSIQSRQPGSSNIRKSIRCRKNEVSSLGDYPHSHQKHVSSGIISSRTKSGDKPKRQQNWRGSIFKNESVLNAILGIGFFSLQMPKFLSYNLYISQNRASSRYCLLLAGVQTFSDPYQFCHPHKFGEGTFTSVRNGRVRINLDGVKSMSTPS